MSNIINDKDNKQVLIPQVKLTSGGKVMRIQSTGYEQKSIEENHLYLDNSQVKSNLSLTPFVNTNVPVTNDSTKKTTLNLGATSYVPKKNKDTVISTTSPTPITNSSMLNNIGNINTMNNMNTMNPMNNMGGSNMFFPTNNYMNEPKGGYTSNTNYGMSGYNNMNNMNSMNNNMNYMGNQGLNSSMMLNQPQYNYYNPTQHQNTQPLVFNSIPVTTTPVITPINNTPINPITPISSLTSSIKINANAKPFVPKSSLTNNTQIPTSSLVTTPNTKVETKNNFIFEEVTKQNPEPKKETRQPEVVKEEKTVTTSKTVEKPKDKEETEKVQPKEIANIVAAASTITAPAIVEKVEEKKPEVKKTKLDNLFSGDNKEDPVEVKVKIEPPKQVINKNNTKESGKSKYEMVKKQTHLTKKEEDKKKLTEEFAKKQKQEQERLERIEQKEKALTREKDSKEKEKEREKEREKEKEREAKEKEAREKESEKQKASSKIERLYFLFKEGEPAQRNRMSLEYMLELGKLNICGETTLLSSDYMYHIEQMKIRHEDIPQQKNTYATTKNQIKKSTQVQKQPLIPVKTVKDEPIKRAANRIELDMNTTGPEGEPAIKRWGRLDLSSQIKEAEQHKEMLEKLFSEDPLKSTMMDYLNKLTVDTYEEIYTKIHDLIKDDVLVQNKFLDVLFIKALTGKSFVFLYANLCKDLEKAMPQKAKSKDKSDGKENKEDKEGKDEKEEKEVKEGKDGKEVKEKLVSFFKSYLLQKARENISNFPENLMNLTDPEEKFIKLKNYTIGNVNFITELIISRVLFKNVANVIINLLFRKLNENPFKSDKSLYEKMNAVYLESIVIILDKYSTHLNRGQKVKPEEKQEWNKAIDQKIADLEKIISEHTYLPGFIKFKVINLIEKKKVGWELTEVDKIQKAKGMKELEEEMDNIKEKSMFDQDDMTRRIKEDLIFFKDFIKQGGNSKEYGYRITDEAIKKKNCKLHNILQSLKELSLDFINSQEVSHITSLYFYEHAIYYAFKESFEDFKKLKAILIDSLNNLSDMILDNMLLTHFWGNVLFTLQLKDFKLFRAQDIDECSLTDEDQIKAVFEAVKFASVSCDGKYKKEIVQNVKESTIVKNNSELFKRVLKDD